MANTTNTTNALSVPEKPPLSGIAITSTSLSSDKTRRRESQLFHSTQKWGSFNKSTVRMRKRPANLTDSLRSSNTSISHTDSHTTADASSSTCHRCCLPICAVVEWLHIPIFHPVGPFMCVWDGFVLFLLLYTCIEIPYTLAFGIELHLMSVFGVFAFLIDLLLCVDIVFNLRTAYFDQFDQVRLITDPIVIANKYLRGWFWLDLVTSFPLEFCLPTSSAGQGIIYVKALRVFRLFRIVKIVRFVKVAKIFDGALRRLITRKVFLALRLLKAIGFMLLFAHITACVWYAVGCESNKQYGTSWLSDTPLVHDCSAEPTATTQQLSSVFNRYSYAWYWSVVTLFTTGYGDIVAHNMSEQWACSAAILIGTVFFAYFIGTLTSLIAEGDRISSEVVGKMEEAQYFCDKKKLPKEMARAVLTHTRYHCNYNYILDEQNVLNNLPPYLQMDIAVYLNASIMLSDMDIFSDRFLDPVVRGSIALKMRSISCNERYWLFRSGDLANEIYIQRTGRAAHVFDVTRKRGKTKKEFEELKRGSVCGEYSLIQKKRESSVLTLTWCEFYVLEKNDLLEVLQLHYPSHWQKKWAKMKRCLFVDYKKSRNSRQRTKRVVGFNQKPRTTGTAMETDINNSENHDADSRTSSVRAEAFHSNFGDKKQASIQSTVRSEHVNNVEHLKEMRQLLMSRVTEEEDAENDNEDDGTLVLVEDAEVDSPELHDTRASRALSIDATDMATNPLPRTLTTESMQMQLDELNNIANGDDDDDDVCNWQLQPKSTKITETQSTPVITMSQTTKTTQMHSSKSNINAPRNAQHKKQKSSFSFSLRTKSKTKENERFDSLKRARKKTSFWIGSTRQNSELRDEVVQRDSGNLKLFMRQMFEGNASNTDDESDIDAEDEKEGGGHQSGKLYEIGKHRTNRSQLQTDEHSQSENVESIHSDGGDSHSSNTMDLESSPQPPIPTMASRPKHGTSSTVGATVSRGGHNKFGGTKMKKHSVKKAAKRGRASSLSPIPVANNADITIASFDRAVDNEHKSEHYNTNSEDKIELAVRSLQTVLSAIEEDDLINRSFKFKNDNRDDSDDLNSDPEQQNDDGALAINFAE